MLLRAVGVAVEAVSSARGSSPPFGARYGAKEGQVGKAG